MTDKAIKVGQFNGALCRFQVSAFGSFRRAGFSPEVSHKMAFDFGSDLGNLMATDADMNAKVSKCKKDGTSEISLTGKSNVITSRTMSVLRVCQVIDSLCSKEKLLSKRLIPELSENLREYVSDCEKWAALQEWVDTKAEVLA